MSYSISVRAVSVAAAALAVSAQLDEIVAQQPIHEADRAQALAATEAFLGLVREPGEGEEITVSLSGSVSKYREGDDAFNSASVSVLAYVVQKVADG